MRFGNLRCLHLQREMTISWSCRYLTCNSTIPNHYIWHLPTRKNEEKAVVWYSLNMLTRVWQELEYRIDVCRVTRGAHIEHL